MFVEIIQAVDRTMSSRLSDNKLRKKDFKWEK